MVCRTQSIGTSLPRILFGVSSNQTSYKIQMSTVDIRTASRLKKSSFSVHAQPALSCHLTCVFPHMDLKVIIVLSRMTAGREGTNEARRRIRLLLVDFLPVALQVGDAAEGGVAIWAGKSRLPSAVKLQPMVFVLGQGAERQIAFFTAFRIGGRRPLHGLCLPRLIDEGMIRMIRRTWFVHH